MKRRRFHSALLLALLLIGAADPRPALIELQLDDLVEDSLAQTRLALAEDPEQARVHGLAYLEGHLLDRLGKHDESPAAFTQALTVTPALAAHARYRLALNRLAHQDPASAAGLLANLLTNDPPASLIPSATRWLTLAIQEGGDCALLAGRDRWPLDTREDRVLEAAVIHCALAGGSVEASLPLLRSTLETDHTDDAALRAARALATMSPSALEPHTALLVGRAFFHQREFKQAILIFIASLEDVAVTTQKRRQPDRADILYSLARGHYWLGQFPSAEKTFKQAALEATEPEDKARALFQRGRSFALTGDWDAAVASYRDAVATAPTDSWAGAAMLAALRLEWRQGREDPALQLLDRLRSRRSWRPSFERAALFLAVSDIVLGRSDRAGGWLDLAQRARRDEGPEILYWRGRLAEIEGRYEAAVRRWADLLAVDPLHPLALAARGRLANEPLHSIASAIVDRLAVSSRTADLLRSWLLMDPEDPRSAELRNVLAERWGKSRRLRPYLEMQARQPAAWTLWRQPGRSADELLLALGIAETSSPALRRAFPLGETDLALAGSRVLAASGLHHRSLYFAEVVARRLPRDLPHQFLPESFRRLLYPRPWGYLIAQQSSRFGVDPDLLSAIMREESRFNPLAISGAAARGLTQFVWPTGERLAAKLGWAELEVTDLHRPEVAITLGASYLAELSDRFAGRTVQMVAAYNAGEDLARLWQAFCFSREPEEFYSKVGFRQTRGYLEKVLTGRAYYAQVYGEEGAVGPAVLSTESTTGGKVSKLLSK